MVITQFRKNKSYWKRIVLFICSGMILWFGLKAGVTWAVCLASDEISIQTIESAQYSAAVELKPLSEGIEEPEALVPNDSGNYTLKAGTVYRLSLRVTGNISSGYCTFTFTDSGEGTAPISSYLMLVPSEEEKVVMLRPVTDCSFQYDYCWGAPQEAAWNGEETTLKVGEADLVTMAVGALSSISEKPENALEQTQTSNEATPGEQEVPETSEVDTPETPQTPNEATPGEQDPPQTPEADTPGEQNPPQVSGEEPTEQPQIPEGGTPEEEQTQAPEADTPETPQTPNTSEETQLSSQESGQTDIENTADN